MYTFVTDVGSGLESAFVERELALLNAIFDGTALEHHLEPSYYTALEGAVDYAEERYDESDTL